MNLRERDHDVSGAAVTTTVMEALEKERAKMEDVINNMVDNVTYFAAAAIVWNIPEVTGGTTDETLDMVVEAG